MKVTLKMDNESYKTLDNFFEDLFYKNPKLVKAALKFIDMVYSKTNGIMASSWRSNISKLFNCYPLERNEKNMLKDVLKKYSGILPSRGSKIYKILLEKNKNDKIKLNDSERVVLERAFEWNSAISAYYSVIRKLKGVGLIEKKRGYFIKSDKFLGTLKSLKKLFDNFEDNKNIYVTK